jgi:hypothetical protein
LSSFYLNEGWYSSEQLAEVLEANQKMNDHLAKAIGELPEGYTLTTHKLNPESLEGAAGAVVAMTQDRSTEVTAQPEPFEYWNAVEGWVKIEEVRQHFDTAGCGTIYKTAGEDRVPLYTAPPKREWVGLTDEEIEQCAIDDGSDDLIFAHAIEAKLKEKNA